jgi:hypothetical protein
MRVRESMAKANGPAPEDVPTVRATIVRVRDRVPIAPTARATIVRVRDRERIAPIVRATIAHVRERDIVVPREIQIADMGAGMGMVSIIRTGRGWRAVMKSALQKWPG